MADSNDIWQDPDTGGANWGANVAGGAGTGAAAGASIGTAVMPGYGTAIGAGVGAVLGIVGGIFQSIAEDDQNERKHEALRELAKRTNTSYDNIKKMYEDFYANYKTGGTQADAIEAASKIRNWDSTFAQRLADSGLLDDEGNLKNFDYDKNVEDFLNPYMGNVIDASNAKIQHSAAGAALGRSTGAAKAISENTAKEYDKLYNTALDAYKYDRSQSYNEWSDYAARQQQLLNTMLENDKWGIEQQKALGDQFLDWQAQQVQNYANLEKDRVNTNAQITMAAL